MTGGRMAHPLLLTLANIDKSFRMKATNHAFVLVALLPIPKFIHKDSKICSVLGHRVFHACLDFILAPLKTAATVGIMMSDPLGNLRYCFTPLASYIVDTPESALIAGVAGKTSSVTMASYRQFGEPFRHEPRTASTTLAQLDALEQSHDPWGIENYVIVALQLRLNGVHRPFWRDWPLSDPSTFLTPEPLHHWHRMFWDHDAKWCIRVLGAAEIDFRFSVLHPHMTFRHFKEGISKLKQVTGRDHRDVQRYIIPVIAGAVPLEFLIAVRALADFRYLAQASEITSDMCTKIEGALAEFHQHKDAIILAGGRIGKKRKVINNFYIPKLEFLQSVVPNIRENGVAMQWSADITERAHITEIKLPSDSTNNQEYEPQICRFLDRAEKCRRFDLATAIRDISIDFRSINPVVGIINDNDNDDVDADDDDDDDDNRRDRPTHTVDRLDTMTGLHSTTPPVKQLAGMPRRAADYFSLAHMLEHSSYPHAPSPHRTFVAAQTALHLNRRPSYSQMKIDVVAAKFKLPDLSLALSNYFAKCAPGHCHVSEPAGNLPFDTLEVWEKLRVQNRAYHAPHEILLAQTVNATPPSTAWPCGRADTVLVNTNSNAIWPRSGMTGMKSILPAILSILIYAKDITSHNCDSSSVSFLPGTPHLSQVLKPSCPIPRNSKSYHRLMRNFLGHQGGKGHIHTSHLRCSYYNESATLTRILQQKLYN
jgi:hypothetical protein